MMKSLSRGPSSDKRSFWNQLTIRKSEVLCQAKTDG
jgi:hypothetical protein